MEDYINSYCWSASTYVIMDREYNAFRRFKDTDVLMYNPKDRLSMMRGKFDELGVRSWKLSDVIGIGGEIMEIISGCYRSLDAGADLTDDNGCG